MSINDFIKAIIALVILILRINFMVDMTLTSFTNLYEVEKED